MKENSLLWSRENDASFSLEMTDNLQTLEGHQRQLKREKLTEKGCETNSDASLQ